MERGGGADERWSARRRAWRSLGIVATASALAATMFVLVVSTVTTSSARISASTQSDGFLGAGTVVIDQPGTVTEFFFDADNLYPGKQVAGCVEIAYTGSVEAGLRLFARVDGGSGLAAYIDLRVAVLDDAICPPDADDPSAAGIDAAYAGRLDDFWTVHGDYATGLELVSAMDRGDGVAVVVVAEVVDDNDAAGRDVELSFVFESRPT